MDRESPGALADHSGKTVPEAWVGEEVVLETTEALSTDLRAADPVRLEGVNDRGVLVLVGRHHEQSHPHRYFYPWGVVGWIRPADEDERGRNPRPPDP